jgi:hypothetical protein
MFHVLDHADVVYTGELSESTQYVIEHYGEKLDEAVQAGIKILYTDALHSLRQVRARALNCESPKSPQPVQPTQSASSTMR